MRPFCGVFEIGNELPIRSRVIERQHPANQRAQAARADDGAQQAVFQVVVDVAEILVFHDARERVRWRKATAGAGAKSRRRLHHAGNGVGK